MVNPKYLNKFEFGRLVMPEKIYKLELRKEIETLYEKLHFDNFNYLIIANIFFASILISLVIYILIYPILASQFSSYFSQNALWRYVSLTGTWFILNLSVYIGLIFAYFFSKDSKFKKGEAQIERDLPDFIDNLVSNLKGGISLEKALLKSVRKDQKALLREVTLINEKIMMGKGVIEALREFRHRFNSPIIQRTFFLVEEGIKGGGNLAAPLSKISDNLKKIYNLNEEIKGNSSGFSLIISVITIVVAPLLFALAITLLTFVGDLLSLLSEANTGTRGGGGVLAGLAGAGGVPEQFKTYLINFSYGMVTLITIFSSLIVAQLKNERLYTALKYMPIYVIVALILFNVFSEVLLNFFGTLLQD